MRVEEKQRVFRKSFMVLAVVVCMLFGMTVTTSAEVVDAVKEARDAIIQVNLIYKDDAGTVYPIQGGSGFLINTNTVITNKHVLDMSDQTKKDATEALGVDFVNGGKAVTDKLFVQVAVKRDVTIEASVEQASKEVDFAILTLSKHINNRKPLKLSDVSTVTETQQVYALGFPSAVTWAQRTNLFTSGDVTITDGIVSKITTEVEGFEGVKYIQHGATLSEGNSGGPLINAAGDVVGVNRAGIAGEYYYSIAIDEIMEILDTFSIEYTKAGESNVNQGVDGQTSRTALQSAIDEAGSVSAESYSSESFQSYTLAVEDGKIVLQNENATEEEMSSALEAITSAKSNLTSASDGSMEENTTLSTAALEAAIKDAESVEEKSYTEESFAVFSKVLDSAKNVLSNPSVAQSDIDGATKELNEVRTELVKASGINMILIFAIAGGVILVIIIIILIIYIIGKKKNIEKGNTTTQTMQQQTGTQMQRRENIRTQENGTTMLDQGTGETTVLNQGAGETSILGGQTVGKMVRQKTREVIEINRPEFIIGRERRKSDYCIQDNSTIGRAHAKITVRAGKCYITDLNSTNYTYVNGSRLVPNREMILSNGDKIKLSDEEFEFRTF